MTANLTNKLQELMEAVVDFSIHHVHNDGIPFTAFVIDANGNIVGRGVNRVREHHDPTAHAEVEAIRDACRNSKNSYLHNKALLAYGEPCAMCYMNAVFAGISQIYYAVDRNEAASYGFDYRNGYQLLSIDPKKWQRPTVKKLPVSKGLLPFIQYQEQELPAKP